mmetsp:Transcript_19975/g.39233  ORF Transcript_19975/g.39233 Transcript_19975/m.39233 type:complete len:136 (-) Transcript_19975:174-581(-)|eukprot:CAMPEP_0171484770 /NCGR_PEP_ID=MMETSP0958-20121227/185_1 /TAXON_ID=87120 /ORGANISM="Aurantiochytrium limacinum, Strain ATCCMYA-1381" /LENGTH=135 /DNA_ID=CAMNT_0012017507 /DNA_START=166 /DNA_END=573 /DNA_ORIENTATION=+
MSALDFRSGISGALLWGSTAYILNQLLPLTKDSASGTSVLNAMYLGMIPTAIATYEIFSRLSGANPNDVDGLRATAVGLSTAAVLEGLTFSLAPQLYGETAQQLRTSGGILLWGIGVFCATAAWRTRNALMQYGK